jgi:hypothetical protein
VAAVRWNQHFLLHQQRITQLQLARAVLVVLRWSAVTGQILFLTQSHQQVAVAAAAQLQKMEGQAVRVVAAQRITQRQQAALEQPIKDLQVVQDSQIH